MEENEQEQEARVPEGFGRLQDARQDGAESSYASGTVPANAQQSPRRNQDLVMLHDLPREINVEDYGDYENFDDAMKAFLLTLFDMGKFLAYNPWQSFAKELTELYPSTAPDKSNRTLIKQYRDDVHDEVYGNLWRIGLRASPSKLKQFYDKRKAAPKGESVGPTSPAPGGVPAGPTGLLRPEEPVTPVTSAALQRHEAQELSLIHI